MLATDNTLHKILLFLAFFLAYGDSRTLVRLGIIDDNLAARISVTDLCTIDVLIWIFLLLGGL